MSESCGRGIDIGGTRIKAVRVDASGQILKQLNAPTLDDVDALIATIGELVDQLGGEGPLGIASPGLAATDNRSIRWMQGRMEAVEGLVWGDALNQLAMVLNDAQAATLAEAWVGAAAGLQHVVMLTLGTGVGGGVIGNGQLLQGAIGRAGALGAHHFGPRWSARHPSNPRQPRRLDRKPLGQSPNGLRIHLQVSGCRFPR